jgi:hypothetical protein
MAIRTKKYTTVEGIIEVRAVQITAKNLAAVVQYIRNNGGGATGHLGRAEYNRPARIRIKQRTYGTTWSKLDWRVAKIGDYIVRYSDNEFARVKAVDFVRDYTEV